MPLEESRIVRISAAIPNTALFSMASGYAITDQLVLTVAHVVAAAAEAGVLEGQPARVAPLGGTWLAASVVWADADDDLAILRCEQLRLEGSVRWGRLQGSEPIEWGAAGYPAASADPQFGRQAEHVFGRTSPISGRDAGRLALTLESRVAQNSTSPWAGLSGAAVFCGDTLVGVITAESISYNRGLTGVRIEKLCEDEDLSRLLGGKPVLEDVLGEPRRGRRSPSAASDRSRRLGIGHRHTPKVLADVADLVAIGAHAEWSYEATQRQLDDPYAMSVQWEAIDPALVSSWSSILKLAATGPGWPPGDRPLPSHPPNMAGADNDLVRVLDRIPTRRLIVTGEPGAGKTILLVRLLLDMLERRRRGGPVPVMLPLASWDVFHEELYDWVERILVTNNPALASSAPSRPSVTRARAMLEAGLFVLLLDSLDEMPVSTRRLAVTKINLALLPGQALILASRTDAFREVVETGAKVAGAAGVTVLPLERGRVFEYLRDSSDNAAIAQEWDTVACAIDKNPTIPVAGALTTPLMASLARAIYNSHSDDGVAMPPRPNELLAIDGSASSAVLASHLFDAFVPAAYRPHPNPSLRRGVRPADAMRWLEFIATDMERRLQGVTDFEWWRLCSIKHRIIASVIAAAVVGSVGGICIPYQGLGIGLIVTFIALFVLRSRVRSSKAGLVRGLVGGIVGGQAAALLAIVTFGTGAHDNRLETFLAMGVAYTFAVFPFGDPVTCALAAFAGFSVNTFYEQSSSFSAVRHAIGSGAHVINGIGLGLLVGMVVGLRGRSSPARGLRWSFLGASGGAVCGLIFSAVAWLQEGPATGLISGLILTIGGAMAGGLYGTAPNADLTRVADPLEVLRRDRRTFLFSLALGIPAGFGVMLANAPPGRSIDRYGQVLGISITDMIALSIVLAFLQATWGYFILTRAALAITGKIPWRLMAFLRDAHETRGVLRRAGGVYQFRHIDLQRRLATRSSRRAP